MSKIEVVKFKRADSRYWYTSYIPTQGAQPVRESTGTEAEVEAEGARLALEKKLNRDAYYQGGDKYEDVAGVYIKRQTSEHTKRTWIHAAKLWHDSLKGLYLPEINEGHVDAFVKMRRRQGVCDTSVKSGLAFLSALLSFQGVPWHKNPVKTYDKKHLKRSPRRLRYASHEEERRLIKLAKQPIHGLMIAFAIETGLRKTELLTLKTDRIDLERRELVLTPQDCKGNRGRMIPLTDRAIQILGGDGLGLDFTRERQWVFCYPNRVDKSGQPRRMTVLHQWWFPLRERAGCEDLHWHDLRHTFASRWLQDGGTLASLQRVMGHSNIQQTLIYAHLERSTIHHELAQLDRNRRARSNAQPQAQTSGYGDSAEISKFGPVTLVAHD